MAFRARGHPLYITLQNMCKHKLLKYIFLVCATKYKPSQNDMSVYL